MHSFGSNFLGRLAKIQCPTTKPLLPVCEAISNSIDSLQASNPTGKIDIKIIRAEEQHTLQDQDEYLPEIIGFEISDNGAGLNKENFNYFCELDTRHKAELGGQGIGRLTWLKVFEFVAISSVYSNGNGGLHYRKFTLKSHNPPIQEKDYKEGTSESKHPKTTIKLYNFKLQYKKNVNKSLDVTIDKLLCHFLPLFIKGTKTKITIHDRVTDTSLNDKFYEIFNKQASKNEFTICDHKFNSYIIPTNTARENKNKVIYCAHGRAVTSTNISDYCKYLSKLIRADGVDHMACYVTGDYLDHNVMEERVEFRIKDNPSEMLGLPIGWNEIKPNITSFLRSYAEPQVNDVKKEQTKNLEAFVSTNPKYRRILKDQPEIIDKLSALPSEEEMISALEIEHQKKRISVRARLTNEIKDKEKSLNDKRESYRKIIAESYGLNKDILADYILDRKSVLDILEELISKREDGKPHLEEDVHSIIFPMRTSSEAIDYDEHNLWVIDERLGFHRIITSDLTVKKTFKSKSLKRPDILCYTDEPKIKQNNFASAVLIEFKRPISPSHHYNPVDQITDLISDLKEGQIESSKGRKITFQEHAQFYAYIITDFDELTLKDIRNKDFIITPDGDGYFKHWSNLNAYIEFINYDKLILDAQKRNYILFDKLGIK